MNKTDPSIKSIMKEADHLRARSLFHQSLELYLKARAAAISEHNIIMSLESAKGAAHAARLIGDYTGSLSYYQDALDLAEAQDNLLTEADCLIGTSLALKGLCMWKDALRHLEAAKSIYKRLKDKKGMSYAHWTEGAIWRVAGDIKKAIAYYQRARKGFQDNHYQPGVAYSLCGIAGCTRIAGRFRESLKYYEEANALFSALKDKFGRAYSHCGIGNAFRMLAEHKRAEEHFKKAIKLYEEIGDIVSCSYTLWSLANLYKVEGSYHKADGYIKKAQRNFEKTGDIRGIAYCEMTIAEMMFLKGEETGALELIKHSLGLTKKNALSLEYQHCALLHDLMRRKDTYKHISSYKKLGITLKDRSLPLHIP